METGAQDDDIDSMENMIMLGEIENPLIVLTFEIAVYMCLAMLLMLFVDKVYMAIVVGFVKVFGQKAEKRYKWRPLNEDDNKDDHELGNTYYPMLLVQIPMCNEKEVYKLSIRAACGLSWPSNRIIVQVLDDSTDPVITDLMKMECERWASKGINIKYEIRENRVDHKAGSLKAGMSHSYVKDCDFIAIFDADFQPEPDFLSKTVPYLLHNPQLALVQARWTFVNGDECLMTRMQEISMNYHFTVEQEVGSSTYAFFGFNGSAGVWRMAALNEAGGWNGRTTVEDMDLAVRASLKGWKFLYLDSVKVKNELPSTFKTYRNQQHRWSCGPANLFKKMVVEIVRNEKVCMLKKLYLIYSFFFVRKIVAHMITFVLFCVVLPASTFVPEVEIPKWGVIYIPSIITLLNAIATPRSVHLVILSILFENVMSMHRTRATLSGLFEVGRVNEWVVTKKLGGASHKFKFATKTFTTFQFLIEQRFHLAELGMGAFLLFCGVYGVVCRENLFLVLYLFAQAMAFFVMGFGYVGTFVPS